MTDIKSIFADKKFPTWISHHNIFQKYNKINKIFPEMGLDNCEKSIEIDNKEQAKQSAKDLVYAIREEIYERIRTISKYTTKQDITSVRKNKFDNCLHLLRAVAICLKPGKSVDELLVVNNGRITLNLAHDINAIDGKTLVFKSGERLFSVYSKLNEILRDGHFLSMSTLENIPAFREFSSKNVPSLTYTLKFSSAGSDGAWDIATMSMRGITSCQTWGSGQSSHIVGSIIDPFTAIIYLSSGENHNEFGSKMIRRCVVRFAVSKSDKKPFLFLEKMYPAYDKATETSFISFIKEKTNNQFDVVYWPSRHGKSNAYVPCASSVQSLLDHDRPYRDSNVNYEIDISNKGFIKDQIEIKLKKLYDDFANQGLFGLRAVKISSIPKSSRDSFKKLVGKDWTIDYSHLLYDNIYDVAKTSYNVAVNNAFDKADKMIDNVDDFLVGSVESCLTSSIDTQIATAINKTCTKSFKKSVLDKETVNMIAKISADKIKAHLTTKLAKLKSKQAEKTKITTPIVSTIHHKFLN